MLQEQQRRLVDEQHSLCQQLLQRDGILQAVSRSGCCRSLLQKAGNTDCSAVFARDDSLHGDKTLARLRAVEASLSLFDQQMYGICADCEEEIPPEQLIADPAAQRCQPCAERYQRTAQRRPFLRIDC